MKLTKIHLGLVVIAALLAIVLILSATPQNGGVTGAAAARTPGDMAALGEKETIRMGMSSVQPLNGLLTVAYAGGFFEREGLDIEATEFTSGKEALQALLGGSLDLSVSGEVPLVFAALQGNNFSIITQLVQKTNGDIRIVALKDGSLDDAHSYFTAKKRKLATSFGGGPEFYTHNFLKKYNLTNIELVNIKPADMPLALAAGSVDAIAVFEPFAFIAEQKLGNQAISFDDASIYSEFFVLVAGKDWSASHPQDAEAIVRSLVRASDFIAQDPNSAKAILSKHTKLDESVLDGIWDKYVFKPALTHGLLDYMHAEAEWAKSTNKTKAEAKIPDFMDYIYPNALLKAAPENVALGTNS